MLDCKRLERYIIDLIIAPVQCDMEHKCSSHVHDNLNCTLCTSILVLRTDKRERLLLTLGSTVFPELLGCKHIVVAVVLLDFNAS